VGVCVCVCVWLEGRQAKRKNRERQVQRDAGHRGTDTREGMHLNRVVNPIIFVWVCVWCRAWCSLPPSLLPSLPQTPRPQLKLLIEVCEGEKKKRDRERKWGGRAALSSSCLRLGRERGESECSFDLNIQKVCIPHGFPILLQFCLWAATYNPPPAPHTLNKAHQVCNYNTIGHLISTTSQHSNPHRFPG